MHVKHLEPSLVPRVCSVHVSYDDGDSDGTADGGRGGDDDDDGDNDGSDGADGENDGEDDGVVMMVMVMVRVMMVIKVVIIMWSLPLPYILRSYSPLAIYVERKVKSRGILGRSGKQDLA